MGIRIDETDIPGVKLVQPGVFGDARGFFSEVYNAAAFAAGGVETTFVQDNHSKSAVSGTVRGLHFQRPPYAQAKLVRVTRGRVLDIAVDLRRESPSYGHHVAVELSATAWNQLFVPVGFAHGFCTLEDDTEVIYKVGAYYAPDHEGGIYWNDPDLALPWPVSDQAATVSEKDRNWPRLAEIERSPF